MPPAEEHEVVVGLEGSLHDEAVVVVGVLDVLDHQVGVDEQRFGGGVFEPVEGVLGGEGGGEVVDEIGEVGVVGGLLLDKGADLRVDKLHYNNGSIPLQIYREAWKGGNITSLAKSMTTPRSLLLLTPAATPTLLDEGSQVPSGLDEGLHLLYTGMYVFLGVCQVFVGGSVEH